MAAVLIDTTLLAHAFLGELQDARTLKAQAAIEDALLNGDVFVCVQNIGELSAIGLKFAQPAISGARLTELAAIIAQNMGVLWATPETLATAISAVERHGIAFWDAMVWAVAKEHGVPLILSEYFQDGRCIDGVTIRNPLT